MKYLLTALIIFFPAFCNAEAYLCLAEAGAGLEHGGPKGIHAEVYDVEKAKFIMTDADGSWVVKKIGEEQPLMRCETEFLCEIKGGFSSVFFRGLDGVFAYVTMLSFTGNLDRQVLYAMKGRCSKI